MKFAKSKVLSNYGLTELFRHAIKNVTNEKADCVQLDSTTIEKFKNDFTSIIFNARVNKFFKAQSEIELETNKKAVGCKQLLRDALKTFSSLKARQRAAIVGHKFLFSSSSFIFINNELLLLLSYYFCHVVLYFQYYTTIII